MRVTAKHVLANSLTNLKQLLDDLDVCLTNKKRSHSDTEYEDFLRGNEFYLSDGGYSRVVRYIETGELFLTQNSLQKAKDQWDTPEAMNLREEIIIVIPGAIKIVYGY